MHVVVNAAESVDGKLSTRRRQQVAISGAGDFERVEDLRAAADAVMVGAGTVRADDPHLVLDDDHQRERRERGDAPTPARVVASSRAALPTDARVFDDEAPTYLLVGEGAPDDRIARFSDLGVNVVVAGVDTVDLERAFEALEDDGVEHLMVEGGGELLFSLFEAGLVDELSVFVGPMVVGGRDAPTLVDGRGFADPDEFVDLSLTSVQRLDEGVLLEWSVD